ncbi:unnamed protein product [Penicillium salamii]|uniref:Uncharacterized protein n=1 Tax=Penicillium salamii TaxID=1612424 RepID=A0A9W4JU22_9EURO|nr:unnamed protein product [Penicillium salamii]
MGGPHSRLLLRTARIQPPYSKSRRLVRNLYNSAPSSKQLHDPSPSELLRFILTDSIKSIESSHPDAASSSYLRELFSHSWKSNSPPPPLWTSLKGLAPHNEGLLQGLEAPNAGISALKSLVERYANDEHGAALLQAQNGTFLRLTLQRCQLQNTLPEILSVISDIIARLDRLQLPVQPGTYATGISFAMLELSAPALGQFVIARRLKGMPAIGLRESVRIIKNCSDALDHKVFEDSHYDRSLMLAVITGEGDFVPHDNIRLHDSLYWTQPSDKNGIRYTSQLSAQDYISLLAKLGSGEVLHTCWSSFLKNVQPKNHHSCFAAYQVVLALIQSTNSEVAVNYLEQVSQYCGDNLPFIARFPNLQILIDDPLVGDALPDLVRGEDYIELLDVQLDNMNQRMGLQWNSDCQEHSSAALEPSEAIREALGDQYVPNIGVGSTDSNDAKQLWAELRARGCSKSPAALNGIVDLLHDHNGQSVEIATHLDYSKERLREFRSRFGPVEFRWAPEHSPIEFSDSRIPLLHEFTRPSTPLDLGLIRARLIVGGVPQSGANSLHLMQLGNIYLRHGLDEPWQLSGYILVWDRHLGELLGLYVGQTSGVIDSGPTSVGPFGALMHISPSSNAGERTSPNGMAACNCWGPYYLDIDPSPDLEYDLSGETKQCENP